MKTHIFVATRVVDPMRKPLDKELADGDIHPEFFDPIRNPLDGDLAGGDAGKSWKSQIIRGKQRFPFS